MSGKSTAIAVLTKTPQLSSIKTRLAKSSSKDVSQNFFYFAVQSLQETLFSAQLESEYPFDLYLALAEESALDLVSWQRFSNMWQGSGCLGAKLNSVYSKLIKKYDQVILLGMDSPQIDSQLIEKTLRDLRSHEFSIGPAHDGGFYLFAGSKPINKEVWLSVEYSSHQTMKQLTDKIEEIGSLNIQKSLIDVDLFDDMFVLLSELEELPQLTSSQIQLRNWISELIIGKSRNAQCNHTNF